MADYYECTGHSLDKITGKLHTKNNRRHYSMTMVVSKGSGAPTGFRTPVSALRGPRPGPLDDGGSESHSTIRVFKRQQSDVLLEDHSVSSKYF